jgi:hypothetical protein
MATPAHPRKTTPKVRDGQVQKKNRWAESVDADDALLGKLGICFEVRAPGPGRRHVVTEVDVRRFLRCIPDWESHAEGLSAIVLGDCDGSMGEYDSRGIIYLYSWDRDLFWDAEEDFFEEHRATLTRLGVPHDAPVDGGVPLYFDERSARAFQLVHIFLHELGHHVDRRMERARARRRRRHDQERAEEFAEAWGVQMEDRVWPRYKEFFGPPGTVRVQARAAAGETSASVASGEPRTQDDIRESTRPPALELEQAMARLFPTGRRAWKRNRARRS